MVWFKVDDGFWAHPKVLELDAEPLALWVRAGSYCAAQLTNGKVSNRALRMLDGDHNSATALVLAGLWDFDDSLNCWWFHDWAEYQPTREEVLKERAAAAERKRASRERARGKSQGESQRDVRVTDGERSDSPTRPDPTRPLSTSNEVESARGALLSPFCKKHPEGTENPCRACGTARTAFDAAKAAERSKPTPLPRREATCPDHPEWPVPCAKGAQIQAEAKAS